MIQVAILGFGVVGSGTAEVLTQNKAVIEKKVGQPVSIKYILDLRDFPDSPFADKVVHDFNIIVNDPEISLVAEMMGGSHPAYDFTLACLKAGKSVVTSNKEVVANFGTELLNLARENGVAYLDFAETFSRLEESELIVRSGNNEKGEPTYVVTGKGRTVVESMQGDILPSILEESLTCALRHLDFTRRGVKATCRSTPNPKGGYDFTCALTEGDTTLLSITLWADSKARADLMEAQFRTHPENTDRATLALMTGNVNYLFDS